MIKVIGEFENVWGFKSFQKFLFVLSTGRELTRLGLEDGAERKIIRNDSEFSGIYYVGERIFINSGKSCIVVNPETTAVEKTLPFKLQYCQPGRDELLGLDRSSKQYIFRIWRASNLSEISSFELKPGNRNFLLEESWLNSMYLNPQKLNSYDIHTGAVQWNLDVSSYSGYNIYQGFPEEVAGGIDQIMGSWNGIVWLGLSSGFVLGVDMKSGEIIHKIGRTDHNFPITPLGDNAYIPWGNYQQLEPETGAMVGLRSNWFMFTNLEHEKPFRKYIDVSSSMKLHEIEADFPGYQYPFVNGKILFADSDRGKLGAFDFEKREVVWTLKLNILGDGIGKILEMDYQEGYWFVLDKNQKVWVLTWE